MRKGKEKERSGGEKGKGKISAGASGSTHHTPALPVTPSTKDAPGRSNFGMIQQATPGTTGTTSQPATPRRPTSRPFFPSPLYYIIPQILTPYTARF